MNKQVTILLSGLNHNRISEGDGMCSRGVNYTAHAENQTVEVFGSFGGEFFGEYFNQNGEAFGIVNAAEVFMYLELIHKGISITDADVHDLQTRPLIKALVPA